MISLKKGKEKEKERPDGTLNKGRHINMKKVYATFSGSPRKGNPSPEGEEKGHHKDTEGKCGI